MKTLIIIILVAVASYVLGTELGGFKYDKREVLIFCKYTGVEVDDFYKSKELKREYRNYLKGKFVRFGER